MKKTSASFRNIIRVIFLNIIILLILLYIINFGSILTYNAYLLFRGNFADNRANFPNYENVEWARQHFIEFGELESEYKSFIGWRRLPYTGQTIRIGENGIRRTPQSEVVRKNAPVVAFLGGSTMWGTGSNDENTIPAHFVEVSQGQYRAINLGESGYNAFQGYISLNLHMLDGLEPDIIISYDGVNELPKLAEEMEAFAHTRELQIRKAMKGRDSVRTIHVTLDQPMTFKSFFIGPIETLVKAIIGALKPYDEIVDENIINNDYYRKRTDRVAKELLDSWLSAKNLAENNGALFIAILQPNVSTGSPKIEHLDNELDEIRIQWAEMLYPRVLEMLNTSEYEDLKDSFIYLGDAFDKDQFIYIDWCHVSPDGNRIIAELIYDHIESLYITSKGE